MSADHSRIDLAGIVVDLLEELEAIGVITSRASQPAVVDRLHRTDYEPPLAVVSANLDHVVQFGADGRWRRTLGDSLHPTSADAHGEPAPLEWLTLLDGAPLVAQANRLTGRTWKRLAGSDLIGPLLDAAEAEGITVGFLGGSYLVQRLLSRRLTRSRPGLVVAGMWSPDRSELADEEASLRLAAAIAEAGPQLLIVGLGKPRQELWISRYGPATGANVLLAFGAVVDFLADAVQRAPQLASDHGLEWAWRLAREPRRLAKRYLLDDPPGLLKIRRSSRALENAVATATPAANPGIPRVGASTSQPGDPVPRPVPGHVIATDACNGRGGGYSSHASLNSGRFVSPGHPVDVAILVVTYNNAADIEGLLSSLRTETDRLRFSVIVADNDSADDTLKVLQGHPDVLTVPTGGNLGYAAGINVAMRWTTGAGAILILNPDLRVEPGSITALYDVIRAGTANLVVPRLEDNEGKLHLSLRREPSVGTAWGDALFGRRWLKRPGALAETDFATESYQFAHEVDWATGAAVMVRADTARELGEWDERFFLYSEETDFFRRAREAGAVAWYEPRALMKHAGAGSGTSNRLVALMAVNRIRYVRKHHSETTAALFRAGVLLNEFLRVCRPERRGVLRCVTDEATWDALPGPTATTLPAKVLAGYPEGAVIIPAHNEAAGILRTLASLEPVLRTGRVEVIVVCNGCTDNTAELAASVPGVQVIESAIPSKTAAMNAGDALATRWPRVYLDADIEISPTALRQLLQKLRHPVLAARPTFRYAVSGATRTVRAYYRARRRLPSTSSALWGAGVFGLTREGHERFGEFPDVTADDFFVDQQFSAEEKMIVATPPVTVRVPRDAKSLLKVLRRNHRGPAELRSTPPRGPASGEPVQSSRIPVGPARTVARTAPSTAIELLRSVRGPLSAADALSYTSLAAAPRLYRLGPRRMTHPVWERDESSRRI